jgi:hypothetical protein
MVEMASAICTGVGRSMQYFHIPGPKDRIDDAYFARSKIFCTSRPSYLGLVHHDDSAEREKNRSFAAGVSNFSLNRP